MNSKHLQPLMDQRTVAAITGLTQQGVAVAERRALKKLEAGLIELGVTEDDLPGEKHPRRLHDTGPGLRPVDVFEGD